ncbi:MAG: DUF1538 domain-containing protein [Clostridia bacterium]|nr:DUF1538 domain-containing protein [Clostridia bacterium]
MNRIKSVVMESMSSVLPIAAIVLLLSITIAPISAGILVQFLFGTLLLIIGMSFFTIGSTLSMQPLGEGIGVQVGKSKKIFFSLIVCFLLGMLITIAEPDLQVLAEQVPSIPNMTLIVCVAVGVGIFLSVAVWRAKKGVPLSRLLIVFYAAVFLLTFFVAADFIPTAFDSGGVTTGPITVPFIMALGAGVAGAGKDSSKSGENSFGLVALCSIGPILSVLVLSLFFDAQAETTQTVIVAAGTTQEAFLSFVYAFPAYLKEVAIAFLPIVALFFLYQIVFRRFHKSQVLRMCVGFVYTYVGLVLFLCGANVGFMPVGKLIGSGIVSGGTAWWLIPIGMLMGYFVVSAEPAVHSLKTQVEEVTNGAISRRSIGLALSIGVAVSVGLSMLRVLLGISILPFLIGGYAISLAISFFVPHIYTGIAFDSGGVASGPMTTTFILPFAVGACEAIGGNIMTDAFGIVAFIAMTPLITIQVLGLVSKVRAARRLKKTREELGQVCDDMLYYEEEAGA